MASRRFLALALVLSMIAAAGPGAVRANGPLPAVPAVSKAPAQNGAVPQAAPAAPGAQGAPAGVPLDWWTAAQESIRRSEYDITWQQDTTYMDEVAAAYQAPNRAQGFRTYFTAGSIRVIPRTEATPSWQLDLSLQGSGDSKAARVSSNRIEYRREGITEWYLNGEDGLVMGFVFDQGLEAKDRGRGTKDGESFVLGPWSLALVNLSPRLSANGSAIEFTTADGTLVLRYGDLSAVDAAGRALPVRISLSSTGFTLHVSPITPDPAAYPLTFSARLSSPSGIGSSPDWTAESNQIAAGFGFAVGTAGDVDGDGYSDVIVGAPYYDNGQMDEGRAYVYHGSAGGLLTTASWFTESNMANAQFGAAVGTAGDVDGDGYSDVIVGAPYYDNGQGGGWAYVYHGSAAGLSPTPNWTAAGNEADAEFGFAVGTAGDVNGDGYDDVVVGAPSYGSTSDDGMAFVYHGSPAGLSATADWSASGVFGAGLGFAVSTAGDVNGDGYADVLIGAPTTGMGLRVAGSAGTAGTMAAPDNNAPETIGEAFIYNGSSTGLSPAYSWYALPQLEDLDLGYAVGTVGDVNGDGYSDIIVGSPHYSGTAVAQGAAYLWYGSASGPNSVPDWTTIGDQANALLGWSVGPAGDVNGDGYADVIVGAPGYDAGATGGQSYVFLGSDRGPSTAASWTAAGNQANASFGAAVGTAGDVNGDGYADVLIGAPGYTNGQAGEGRAFAYHGAADGPSTAADWTQNGGTTGDRFGYSVASAGDVNGDGYADVIVGVYGYDAGMGGEGLALVYYGSLAGLSGSPDWVMPGVDAGGRFGASVGTAGDVNGDGYADVIVGAPHYDNALAGQAFVYHGSFGGLSQVADWTVVNDQSGAYFGCAVGTAGDVNGDGYADVIVGADSYSGGQGQAYLYLGSFAGLSFTPAWTAAGETGLAGFGASVAPAGDVDGDGYSDVVVGAPGYGSDQGRAYLYRGVVGGLSPTPAWTGGGENPGDGFGSSVATGGDVDGDGYADVVVGAPGFGSAQGKAYLYLGSPDLALTPGWTATGEISGDSFGYSVATAGDVDGDGYADVLVGANGYSGSQGKAYLYAGSSAGLSLTPGWTTSGEYPNDGFGNSLATAGDVNGDGYADVLVGADLYSGLGKAYLYLGNGGLGLALRPEQWPVDGFAPIAPLGMSDLDTAVALRLIGRHPLGRAPVKLQWQVAPLGTPFTSTGVISGTSLAWTDVLTTGVVIVENTFGLVPGTPYHWRVRLLYEPGNRLGQPASRWLTMPWGGWQEKDFRTADGPIAGVIVGNDSPTALGQATAFTATADPMYVAYTWDFGDLGSGSGKEVTHTYAAAGVYTAMVTVSNTVDAVTATTVVAVVEPVAGLAAANSGPTALGQPTAFTATVAAGDNVTYAWAFGDGATGTGAMVSHTYAFAGVHTAIVTASNAVSTASVSTTVVVEEVIAGLAAANSGPTALGQPTAFTATVTAGDNVTYAWAFGDGGTASGALVSHTYALAGVYTVAVTASNAVSSGHVTTTVFVDEPIAGLGLVASGPTVLGEPTTFTATVVSGTRVTYEWNFGDGLLALRAEAGMVISHTYAAAGVYTAMVTAQNAASTAGVSTTVRVEAGIVGLAAINNGPTPYGDPTTFTATLEAGSNVAYAWDFGNGVTGAGSVVVHTYAVAGTYTATVVAQNAVSVASATSVARVVAPPSCTVPLSEVSIAGPSLAYVGFPLPFDAAVQPAGATAPISYTWAPAPAGGQGTALVTYTWATTGTYVLSVTAANCGGYSTASQVVVIRSEITATADPLITSTIVYTDPQGLTTTVVIPPGAVTETVVLVYTPLYSPTEPVPVLRLAGHIFTLDAYLGEDLLPGFAFAAPVILTIYYSDEDVAGLAEDALRLYYWAGDRWADAAETCVPPSVYARDLAQNVLAVSLCHLSEYSLLGFPLQRYRVYLPLIAGGTAVSP